MVYHLLEISKAMVYHLLDISKDSSMHQDEYRYYSFYLPFVRNVG